MRVAQLKKILPQTTYNITVQSQETRRENLVQTNFLCCLDYKVVGIVLCAWTPMRCLLNHVNALCQESKCYLVLDESFLIKSDDDLVP